MKLSQGRFRLRIRKRFFTQRVVGHWNRIPTEVGTAPTLSEFKEHLDYTSFPLSECEEHLDYTCRAHCMALEVSCVGPVVGFNDAHGSLLPQHMIL